MAKQILDRFLSKPAATGLSKGDQDAIRTYLADLEEQKKGLASAAFDYVINGGSDSVLLEIAAAQNGASLLQSGSMAKPTRRIDREAAGRRIFGALEGWDAQAVKRLGEVLAINVQSLTGTAACPDFFRALVHYTVAHVDRHPSDPHAAGRLFDGARCLELLALGDADQAAVVDALFAEYALGRWGGDRRQRLLTMNGLAEALAAAPERTLFGARALDTNGRCSFIDFLGTTGLASQPAFFDFLFEAIAGGGKQQTEAALAALSRCDATQIRTRCFLLLASGQADERRAAVSVLVNAGTPEARALLEEQAAREKSAKIREQIEDALRSLRATDAPAVAAEPGGNGYVSIDGDWIAIPEAPPLPPDTPPPATMKDELGSAITEANREARRQFDDFQREHAQLSPEEQKRHYGPNKYTELHSVNAIGEFMDVVSGKADPHTAPEAVRHLTGRWGQWAIYNSVREQYRKTLEAILSHPDITLHHLARIFALDAGHHDWAVALMSSIYGERTAAHLLCKMAEAAGDFRPVLAALPPVGGGAKRIIGDILKRHYVHFAAPRTETQLWPAVAEHLDMIDQALGLAPAPQETSYESLRALELMSILPAPPRKYLQVLLDLAVKGTQEEKILARGMLSSTRSVTNLIIPLLESGEQNRRIMAAGWLRERRDREAIPHLRKALGKEKTDAGRAAFLNTLSALGDDISDQFSEQHLVGEATKGLAKTKTKVGDCVPLDHLPALTWADGRPVPPEAVRWWVVLAAKLKSARGNPMLNLALDRLEQGGAERLGTLVLSSFVAFDTRRPTEAEANAYADANADQMVQSYKRWQPEVTREWAFAQLKAQKLSQYFQSGLDHRGALALARRATASEAVNIVKTYFRDHYVRTSQCKTLLDCLANNQSPAALQFILGISMRYRTTTVQKHAATLVNSIAEEHGWTRDELADRTAPTGGLDESGAVRLQCGDSTYTASLDPGMKVVLRNPEGKVVQSLPSGAGETVAKKAFSTLKKELKQTVQQQSARLYEAMCAGRVWRPEDIIAFLFRHPIVGRLCQRLVFASVNEDGKIIATFRPLDDGSFTDAADDAVDIAGFSGVRIAHRVLVDDQQAATWQQHLKDYEIVPLFEQLARPMLSLDPGQADATEIKDREGYMLDTFTLRSAATKLGYQRGPVGDGGWVSTYEKMFTAADITAVIDFTGVNMGETNMPCALTALRFARGGAHYAMPLSTVPPVLLSETWNDLRTIAAAGSGFDPDWQKKARW